MRWVVLLALVACAEEEVPAVCKKMCLSAASVYDECLTDWDVEWSATGYDDQQAFIHSCETWAWEMEKLENDAVDNELINEKGWLKSTCIERDAILSKDESACSDYTDIDWNNTPWDSKGGNQL
jgi:hypothetical protein